MMKIVKFKSTPDNWKKEFLDIKRNTVRKFDTAEIIDFRETLLHEVMTGRRNLLTIEITNTETGESFKKLIRDVTYFEGVFIISW